MTFDEARAQFPVLERYAYLNAGTFGPMPTAVADAIAAEQQRALVEGRFNRAAFDKYLEDRPRVRAGFAQLVGVPVENVALTTSTSEGCNVVLNGLGLGEGDEVVTTDSEHFGLIGPLAVSPATVRIARVRDRPAADAYETILAEVGPRTKLIALSEVLWINGHRLPWRELREATGIPVLVDGAQSAGAIPVDASDADFYTVSAQKWLCGPDLTGALSVRDPDALRLTQPSYLSQREYDLEAGTFEPQEGADPIRHALHPARGDCRAARLVRRASRVALRARRRSLCTLPRARRRARGGRDRGRPREPRLVPRRKSRGDGRAAGGDRRRSFATCRAPGSCAPRAAGGPATRTSTGLSPPSS